MSRHREAYNTFSMCWTPKCNDARETGNSSSQKCYLTVTWLHAVYKQGTVLVFQVRPCSLVRRHSWATLDKAFEYFWKKKKTKKKQHPVGFVLSWAAVSYLIIKILKQDKSLQQQRQCLLCTSCLQWQSMTDSPSLWGVYGLKQSLSNQKHRLLHALQSLLHVYCPTVPISITGK